MEINISDILKFIWSKKKYIMLWTAGGLLFGIIVGMSLPKQYQAFISLVNENAKQKIGGSAGAIADIMGVGDINEQQGINDGIYPAIIRSTPFLLEFADMKVITEDNEIFELKEYIATQQKIPWWSHVFAAPGKLISLKDTTSFECSASKQKNFCDVLASKISIETDSKDKVSLISTKFQDPYIALSIADSVFTKLERYINTYKTRKLRLNIESNQQMLDQARDNYYNADDKFAEAFDRNQNLISQVARIKLDRLEKERNLTYQIYNQLATQVKTDKIKLQEQTYIATIIEPARLPLFATYPNKKLIAFGTTFLSIAAAVCTLLVKYFKSLNKEGDSTL